MKLCVAPNLVRALSYCLLILIYNASSLAFAVQAEAQAQELPIGMKSPDILPKSLLVLIAAASSSLVNFTLFWGYWVSWI